MAVEIQIMILQYGELNRIYSDFIINHTFSFDKQKFITDFISNIMIQKLLKPLFLNWCHFN